MQTEQIVLVNRQLSEESFVLRTTRNQVIVRAGQCFSVGTEGLAINREYSIYSGADEPYLEFLIRRIEHGAVSTGLSRLAEGDPVQVSGPFGEFCLKSEDLVDSHRAFVFIASGTGIAPFNSFARTYPDLDYQILHGVRHLNEQYEHETFPEGRYFPCVSREDSWTGPRYVTELLKRHALKEHCSYYLCGNRNMIVDATKVLRTRGIPGGHIYMETFF
jgi:ferredoxin--NADP+ reductase